MVLVKVKMRILFSITVLCLFACTQQSWAKEIHHIKHFNEKQTHFLYSSYLKGAVHSAKGEPKEALTELRRVKCLDKESVHVRLKIAALLLSMGRNKDAEIELKDAQKIDPSDIDISLALIFLYSCTKNETALDSEYGSFLEKAHSQKPDNIKISEYLGQFYFYKNRVEDSIKVYEALVKSKPDYIEGIFWLGYLYAESGKRIQAIEAWLRVLKIDGNHAPSLNSLGYVYTQDGVKLDEAEAMIKKAISKEPQNGAYLDSLGWLYFKKKEYKLADDYLNKALVLLRDPVIYEHLGDVWIDAKNLKKALNYYQEGVKYFPNDKNLQEKIKQYGPEDKVVKE